MILTDKEAGAKWCPMVRQPDMGTDGRSFATNRGWTCVGSACAMWRFYARLHFSEIGAGDSPVRGYCGLAGRPEVIEP